MKWKSVYEIWGEITLAVVLAIYLHVLVLSLCE